ncbi:unnamed protein product, partial [Symbiodinium sp. KB8]
MAWWASFETYRLCVIQDKRFGALYWSTLILGFAVYIAVVLHNNLHLTTDYEVTATAFMRVKAAHRAVGTPSYCQSSEGNRTAPRCIAYDPFEIFWASGHEVFAATHVVRKEEERRCPYSAAVCPHNPIYATASFDEHFVTAPESIVINVQHALVSSAIFGGRFAAHGSQMEGRLVGSDGAAIKVFQKGSKTQFTLEELAAAAGLSLDEPSEYALIVKGLNETAVAAQGSNAAWGLSHRRWGATLLVDVVYHTDAAAMPSDAVSYSITASTVTAERAKRIETVPVQSGNAAGGASLPRRFRTTYSGVRAIVSQRGHLQAITVGSLLPHLSVASTLFMISWSITHYAALYWHKSVKHQVYGAPVTTH